MKNRIGWTTCLSIGGQYAVAERLEGGVVGNGLLTFATKTEAQELIDSGQADELGSRGSAPKSRDKWTVDLECPRCGRLDVAQLSQADGYAYVRGDTATRADHVPVGFACIDPETSSFQCSKCQVLIP